MGYAKITLEKKVD
jgi:hypothetical protein